MNMKEEEEKWKRNQEELKRFFEHIPRTAIIGVLCFVLHDGLSNYEEDPSKPFATALAYASVGYVVFQIAHAFARAKRPSSDLVFDVLSILCGFAVIGVAFAAIFHY